MRPRKVPHRTCTGCRAVRPKKDLIRVVRTPEGGIEIDAGGKRPGRGAYLCPSVACLDAAVRGRRLDRALEQTVSPEVVEALRALLVQQE